MCLAIRKRSPHRRTMTSQYYGSISSTREPHGQGWHAGAVNVCENQQDLHAVASLFEYRGALLLALHSLKMKI